MALPRLWVRVLALVVALGITALVIVFRGELARFATYGYVGVFIVSLIGNATIILPVPSLLSVFAAGQRLNPWIVGLVAGVAEPFGELTGYLAGYAGHGAVENRAMFDRIARMMRSRNFVSGYLVIFALPPSPTRSLIWRASSPGRCACRWAGSSSVVGWARRSRRSLWRLRGPTRSSLLQRFWN